ncbi:DUF2333 family protein [Reinekea blandensis]|nr:DUF2333 family protein [Reinekea blandensis]
MIKAKFMRMWNGLRERGSFKESENGKKRPWKTWTAVLLGTLVVVWTALGIYWSQEPGLHDVVIRAEQGAQASGRQAVVGYTTAYTLRDLTNTLLTKPGGYLSNDVTPPSIILDNMPSWEFGVVIQLRDLSRALRKDMSRSQSQSTEDPSLAKAEPLLHFDHNSWMLPSTEGEYRTAIRHIDDYLERLADPAQGQAQFYARSDNLSSWLRDVETRLGSLSQRLSASVGQHRYNTDLSGDSGAEQSTPAANQQQVKTPRFQVDNVFFEARGSSWALIHILKAVEVDFASVLEDKNALVSLQQIIRELEATQSGIWSPFILNGGGFSMLPNHSLVMANYISRANAAIIDLRELLENG